MLVNDAMNRTVLLEIFDDRFSGKATVFTSQLPIAHYYALIGGTKILEAMLSRTMKRNYHLVLAGETLRQKPKEQKREVEKNTSLLHVCCLTMPRQKPNQWLKQLKYAFRIIDYVDETVICSDLVYVRTK